LSTADTPIIELGIATANRIGTEFEAAIDRGESFEAQLFDERYREIPGTNPKQYMTEYVRFTDRLLPPIQDPLQSTDPAHRLLCRLGEGRLPAYAQPPTTVSRRVNDPVWNAAHCRNRRVYNDRAVKKVALNTKRFSAADVSP